MSLTWVVVEPFCEDDWVKFLRHLFSFIDSHRDSNVFFLLSACNNFQDIKTIQHLIKTRHDNIALRLLQSTIHAIKVQLTRCIITVAWHEWQHFLIDEANWRQTSQMNQIFFVDRVFVAEGQFNSRFHVLVCSEDVSDCLLETRTGWFECVYCLLV